MGIKVTAKIDLAKIVKKVRIRKLSFDPDLTRGFAKIEYELLRDNKVLKTGTLTLGYSTKVVILQSNDLQKEAEKYAQEIKGYVLQIDEKTKKALIGTGAFYDLAFTNCNGKLMDCVLQKIKQLVLQSFGLSK